MSSTKTGAATPRGLQWPFRIQGCTVSHMMLFQCHSVTLADKFQHVASFCGSATQLRKRMRARQGSRQLQSNGHRSYSHNLSPGSTGMLCGECPAGFARDNYPELCQPCPDEASSMLVAMTLGVNDVKLLQQTRSDQQFMLGLSRCWIQFLETLLTQCQGFLCPRLAFCPTYFRPPF